MKRHGNLFEKITDIDNLYRAYYNARRGIEKYKDEIPFLATIKQIDKYYTFS